jgi:CheY-like chemotaxis protein
VARLDGRRVLVVENDEDNRAVLCAMLETAGASVEARPSAESALAALAGGHFDCVVSDLAMPGQSGFWLVGMIRRRYPALPTIAVSGHPFPREGILRAGFGDHLLKPVDPDRLCRAVTTLARDRAASAAAGSEPGR